MGSAFREVSGAAQAAALEADIEAVCSVRQSAKEENGVSAGGALYAKRRADADRVDRLTAAVGRLGEPFCERRQVGSQQLDA